MQTVVETQSFIRTAAQCGLSQDEIAAIINTISGNPEAGDEIKGTGGCRKVRIAGRGKGKSGGFRLITFFSGVNIPVFLVTIYSKGSRANLSDAERNALAKLTKELVKSYAPKKARAESGEPTQCDVM